MKYNDISEKIGNGFKFENNKLDQVYIIYIESDGVYVFEKSEIEEFKKVLNRI